MNNVAILYHLLEASAWLVGAHLLYAVCLKKSASLAFRRVYLLLSPFLAATLPFVKLPSSISPAHLPILNIEVIDVLAYESMVKDQTWGPLSIMISLYGMIFMLMAIFLVYRLGKIMQLKQQFKLMEASNGIKLYHTEGKIPTSSFFRSIFWDNRALLSEEEKAFIKAHELAHIQKGHSWDRILLECSKLLFWFHPSSYLLGKELVNVHEFQADSAATQSGTKTSYIQLLAKMAILRGPSLTYSFQGMATPLRIQALKRKATHLPSKVLLLLTIMGTCSGLYIQHSSEAFPSSTAPVLATEMAEPLNLRDIRKEIGYPRAARETGVEGLIVCRVLVDTKGKVINHEVIKAEDDLLRRAVENQLYKLTFKPAQKDGKDIAMWVNIPFNFRLIP
ncbi:MAG: M56 family metallopeptidase [Bacteroidota bacterium]